MERLFDVYKLRGMAKALLALAMAFSAASPAQASGSPSTDVSGPIALANEADAAGDAISSPDDSVSDQSDARLLASAMPLSKGDRSPLINAETIILKKPELKALIVLEKEIDPFGLDSSSSMPVTLKDVLKLALENNLDISINQATVQSKKWAYASSAFKVLPDVNLGFQELDAKGKMNLPVSSGGPLGGAASPGSSYSTLKVNSPFTLMSAGFSYTGYQGGKVLFGAMQSRHQLKAERSRLKATLSDTLLSVTRGYYNLLLNEALLQIRTRAVETSKEQYRINSSLAKSGLATHLDVLQSRTQLASDRQNLAEQQTQRRQSAVQLADILNVNLGADLLPSDRVLKKVRLVSSKLKITELLSTAIDNRPELKQYEQLRLAAKKAIVVASAPLSPTVKLVGNVYGIGPQISNVAALYTIGLAVNWNLHNLGASDLSNIQSARWQAREALLRANKELVTIADQVRTAYLQILSAEQRIDDTTDEVLAADEELRLAKVRFENGLGTNIDVINAQRDLTKALVDKAESIASFNIAQTQLLHDIGLISFEALTSPKAFEPS